MTRERKTAREACAIVLAFAALGAATLAALGPAIEQQALYSWPPSRLPTATPTSTWYAPMILARQSAERLDARVPCGDEPALADAGPTIVVLATARDVVGRNGLEVVRARRGRTTVVRAGGQELARIDATRASPCSFRLSVEGREWAISSSGDVIHRGMLAAPPTVTGFFTELDLRSQPGLEVGLRPIPQDTRPSTRQTVLRVLAALLLAAAVAVLTWPGIARLASRRPARPRLAMQDGVLALVLVAWWLLAPLHYDDGWVRARQLNSLASGGFSNYYEHWGANLPLATWLEWLQHFVLAHTSSLAVDRLPALGLLVLTWVVSRRCLTATLGRGPSRSDAAWWSASIAFLVGATAFGMTLRPEPAVALLAVAALACCIRYASAPSIAPLVAAVLLVGLGVTVHPAGAIVGAPLVVCIPRIWRDARRRVGVSPVALCALPPIGLAWTALLAFLDSDVGHRRESVMLFREGGLHSSGILRELERYGNLGEVGGSALRRELVVLFFVAIVFAIVDRFWRRPLSEVLPTATVAVALLLLAATPSKWIWHFGGFIGIACVAIGVEVGRAGRASPSRTRIVLAGLAMSLTLWAALEPNPWGPLDVGRLTWFHEPLPFVVATLGAATLVVVLGHLGRLRRPDLAILPAVTAGLLAVTILTVGANAAVTDGWTSPRQALSSLSPGNRACGVADDISIPSPGPLATLQPVLVARAERGRKPGLVSPLKLFDRNHPNRWYALPPGRIGVLASRAQSGNRLSVAWGKVGDDRVDVLRTGTVSVPPARRETRWTLLTEDGFPTRPPGADAVSLASRSETGALAGVADPVSVDDARLSTLLSGGSLRALVDPLVFAATPCASIPVLADGVAEAPSLIVEWDWGVDYADTSPFSGAFDVYDAVNVPAVELGNGVRLFIHWTLADPRNALAPATRRVLTT